MSDTNLSATLPPNAHELLAAEISTYERELARLLADGQYGRWVVIRADQLIGICDTFDDAIQAGYERLPAEPISCSADSGENTCGLHSIAKDLTPILTFATKPDGLIVDVRVGLSRAQAQSLRMAGRPVPGPISLRGLVDSGADVTSIADSAIAPLGQLPIDSVLANTANGMTLVNSYAVSFTIIAPDGDPAHDLVRPNLQVLTLPHPPIGFDVLVGLDILNDCLCVLDGPNGQMTIAF